jgi:hypothetical protein
MILVVNDDMQAVEMTPEQRDAFRKSTAWAKMVRVQLELDRQLSRKKY